MRLREAQERKDMREAEKYNNLVVKHEKKLKAEKEALN
jgi:hypothetical protein